MAHPMLSTKRVHHLTPAASLDGLFGRADQIYHLVLQVSALHKTTMHTNAIIIKDRKLVDGCCSRLRAQAGKLSNFSLGLRLSKTRCFKLRASP